METPEKFKPFEAQLSRCPFCGSPAVLHWSEKQTWVWPHCSVCEASIDDWFTPANAVAAWNKRTAVAIAVAEARAQRLTALVREIDDFFTNYKGLSRANHWADIQARIDDELALVAPKEQSDG